VFLAGWFTNENRFVYLSLFIFGGLSLFYYKEITEELDKQNKVKHKFSAAPVLLVGGIVTLFSLYALAYSFFN
jgi:O-antigen/teichoic acid export membrane protein